MKVTKEIDYKVSIKATLNEEGELRVSLVGAAPYGNRTATATVIQFEEDILAPLQRVLAKILHAEGPRAVLLAEQAAASAYAYAVSQGEEI